mmetsp:Transcript_17266/g.50328  ORF Transcript_17266/g.50328 Transcript_17266/m.50328 type:complete len:217 (+) Transcript_17266:1251-1901(+)
MTSPSRMRKTRAGSLPQLRLPPPRRRRAPAKMHPRRRGTSVRDPCVKPTVSRSKQTQRSPNESTGGTTSLCGAMRRRCAWMLSWYHTGQPRVERTGHRRRLLGPALGPRTKSASASQRHLRKNSWRRSAGSPKPSAVGAALPRASRLRHRHSQRRPGAPPDPWSTRRAPTTACGPSSQRSRVRGTLRCRRCCAVMSLSVWPTDTCRWCSGKRSSCL